MRRTVLVLIRFLRRRAGILLISASALSSFTCRAESVEGFVTQIGSGSNLFLGRLGIVMDGNTRCATETLVDSIAWRWGHGPKASSARLYMDGHPETKTWKTASCSTLPWAVGSHILVTGNTAGPNGQFLASQVTLFNVKIEQIFVPDSMNPEWQQGALLEEAPAVSRTEKGWTGTMWLNGYPLFITAGTELLAAPNGTKLSYRPPGSHVEFRTAIAPLAPTLKASRWNAEMPKGPVPPFTASLFQANTWAVFRGRATASGQVLVESIRLWPNETDNDEKKYVTSLTPVVRDPDAAAHVPRTLGFEDGDRAQSVEIVADQEVQDYVTALGSSLIPEYQKALPEEDKTKIHFHFYVVHNVRPSESDPVATLEGLGAWSQNRLDAGAVAFPNGTILLPIAVLAKIGNEAQLAAILSDLITTVLQKQGYITRDARSDPGVGTHLRDLSGSLYDPSDVLALLRLEQTLRIGIRQMYLAGYDIREAPIAWAAAAGRPVAAFSKKDSNQIPWYSAYSFDYLSHFYRDADYGKLKRGEKEYAAFLDVLRRTDPGVFQQTK